ncbi:MAG: hypothetical protein BWK77_07250 [Verrucomicrobia bacterium A1]|nr:MAG: hypothetical protein BWK77_07250 [Verrucomicrobia bacterium A1]
MYNPEAMQATLARHRDIARQTERFTAGWAAQEPQAWQALLLRANTLYDTRRKEEAQAIDRQIIALPASQVPDDLRSFILHRLDSNR